MMETLYRLGRFVIVEHESGALRFVTHAALGMERSGNCYVLGSILAIGPWRHEEHGNLISEFHEQLERLPSWEKTQYYCLASVITAAATGEPANEELLRDLALGAARATSFSPPSPASLAGTFRMGNFRILVSEAGVISWQSRSGSHCLAAGPCRVESGVLILGPPGETVLRNGREFRDELASLSRWDRTPLWCRSLSLLLSTANPVECQAAPALFRPAPVDGLQGGASAVPAGCVRVRAPVLADRRGLGETPAATAFSAPEGSCSRLGKMVALVALCAGASRRRCREYFSGILGRAGALVGHARALASERILHRRCPGKKVWLAPVAIGLLIVFVLAGYAAWELLQHRHSSREKRHHH